MDRAGYFGEEFCRNAAWFDLLLLANHAQNHYFIRNIKVTVNPGQVGYGLDELSRRWRWSRGKVERFLSMLEDEQRIVRQKTNVTTLITIILPETFSESSNADDKANSKANGQQTVKQTDVNKNVKKEKNVKNKILFRESSIFDQQAFVMAFMGTKYEQQKVNYEYYWNAALNWSDSGQNKKIDWVATVRGFMERDSAEGKLKTIVQQQPTTNGSIKKESEIDWSKYD